MPHQGRTHDAAITPDRKMSPARDDVARAAGASVPEFTAEQRLDALRKLIYFGKMIRRSNGAYGTTHAELMTNAMARHLKAKKLACPGFNHEIHPTLKGRRCVEEKGS